MVYTINVTIGGETVEAVYPFSFKNVLDESLDEATITCYSETETFLCGELVEIEIQENDSKESNNIIEGVVKTFNYRFLVSNDNAINLPVGSKRYRHTLYLIEETKLLEGILCPSLTFTNALGKEVNHHDSKITIADQVLLNEDPTSPTIAARVETFTLKNYISTPIESGKSLPSIEDFGNAFLKKYWNANQNGRVVKIEYKSNIKHNQNGNEYESYISVVKEGNEIKKTTSINSSLLLNYDDSNLSIEYGIVFAITYIPNYGDDEFIDYRWYKFKFDVFVETSRLPLKKWSITDCVLRVLECAKPLFGKENPEYTFDGVIYSDGNASDYEFGSQAKKYEKILAPEFTMTQCTLREQLKIIGSFIHAEPRLHDKEIKFDELWIGSKWTPPSEKYTYKAPSIDFANYATSVQTNASNVVSNSDTDVALIDQAPRKVMGSVNHRTEATNAEAVTDFAIQTIQKVEVRIAGVFTKNGIYIQVDTGYVNITEHCFEESIYSLLTEYDEATTSKADSIYYTRGTPNLKGIFYIAPTAYVPGKVYAITNILDSIETINTDAGTIQELLEHDPTSAIFKIKYVPYYSAAIIHGKPMLADQPEYTLYFNQSENQVDTQYLGENIKGIAAKLGNVQEERTYIIPSLTDIPKIGEMLDDYVISTISTEVMPASIKCTVSLTKDFNRLSEYIGVNSVKRLWEVSEREVYDRNIIIRERLVVDYDCPTATSFSVHNLNGLNKMLESALVESSSPCPINTSEGDSYKYDKKTPIFSSTRRFATISSAFGNAITSIMSARDNYSVGSKLVGKEDEEGNVSGYWREEVPYSDYYGRAYWFKFSYQNAKLPDLSISNYPESELDGNNLLESTTYIQNDSDHFLRLRKDSRERITLTCILEIVSAEQNLFAGSALAELNYMVSQTTPESLFLYVFNEAVKLDKFASVFNYPETTYTAYDLSYYGNFYIYTKADGYAYDCTRLNISNIGYNKGFGYIIATKPTLKRQMVIDHIGNEIEYTYNEGGKILLTCTQKRTQNGTLNLYFYITR